MSAGTAEKSLALHGGTPAVRHPLPPMYPGGMRIGREEEDAVLDVLRSKRLFRHYGPQPGPSKVDALEQAFAERIGTEYSLAVSSGSAALTAALAALGVGPGDEVIVPAYTWISTPASVAVMGAVPILAEVDGSLTLDPADVEARITRHTRAIISVHMRGAPCRMAELKSIARKHGVALLEDAAQACGGSYRGQRLGSIGNVGAFSLQFTKIITSGEGGMVTTSDRKLYERALMYHDVAVSSGGDIPNDEAIIGTGCRMAELQGAVALVQLGRLDEILTALRARKSAVKAGMAGIARSKGVEFRTINDPEGDTAISLAFSMPTAERAQYVARALDAEGLRASMLFDPERTDYHVYYHWTPILNKRMWSARGPWDLHEGEVRYERDMCPRTLELLGRSLQVHISPDLTDENVAEMTEALNKVLGAAL